jgi:hypothetical protein
VNLTFAQTVIQYLDEEGAAIPGQRKTSNALAVTWEKAP